MELEGKGFVTKGDGERDAWYEVVFDFLGKWYVFATIVAVGLYIWKGPSVVQFFVDMFEHLIRAAKPL